MLPARCGTKPGFPALVMIQLGAGTSKMARYGKTMTRRAGESPNLRAPQGGGGVANQADQITDPPSMQRAGSRDSVRHSRYLLRTVQSPPPTVTVSMQAGPLTREDRHSISFSSPQTPEPCCHIVRRAVRCVANQLIPAAVESGGEAARGRAYRTAKAARRWMSRSCPSWMRGWRQRYYLSGSGVLSWSCTAPEMRASGPSEGTAAVLYKSFSPVPSCCAVSPTLHRSACPLDHTTYKIAIPSLTNTLINRHHG
jgi:hypothetical protein